MTVFSKIGLIVRHQDDSVANTVNDAISCLESAGCEVLLEHSTSVIESVTRDRVDLETICRKCDLAVVIGGDGSLLAAARALVDHNVPLVGINRGRLGFLVDVPPTEGLEELRAIINGDYHCETRTMLEASLKRDGDVIDSSVAFNDVVVRVHEKLQLMDFDVLIDDVVATHQRADGMIIATPSGSTAYSLSCGGPIVGPSIDAMILQPICAHNLSSRTLLVDGSSSVRIHLWDDGMKDAQVVFDGQVYLQAQLGDVVEVKRKETKLKLLHPSNYDYHRILREKLNWV